LLAQFNHRGFKSVRNKAIALVLLDTGLRASGYANRYFRNGSNIFDLQLLLGHNSLEMVKRYPGSLQFKDAFKGHMKASLVDCWKYK